MLERIHRYKRPDNGVLKQNLPQEQYYVMVEDGTERPFSSEYWDSEREGIYEDAITGEPLFSSFDKFPSGCGWPSFSKPLCGEHVTMHKDFSHGMIRTEVRSAEGNFHLGHVFDDGPDEMGGQRYCINGAALRFIPDYRLGEEGYGYLVPYLKDRKKKAGEED